jgi:hypothetical protein
MFIGTVLQIGCGTHQSEGFATVSFSTGDPARSGVYQNLALRAPVRRLGFGSECLLNSPQLLQFGLCGCDIAGLCQPHRTRKTRDRLSIRECGGADIESSAFLPGPPLQSVAGRNGGERRIYGRANEC